MTWFQGTATDYQDLLDQVEQIATARSVVSVVISAAGTGYSVGDVLTLTAGTFTHALKLEVTTLSGSTVTGVRVYSGGAYSVDPVGASATTVVPAGGTGCTITPTMGSTGWTTQRSIEDRGATKVVLVGGGTGYSTNDTLTVGGGTAITATTLNVDSQTGGVITGVSIVNPGQYLEGNEPGSPVSVTGGSGGDDATFTVTYHGEDSRQQLILEGIGSGSDEIYIGMNSSFDAGSGTRNWEVKGFSGYDSGLSWINQPGVSPGDVNDATPLGSFIPLSNGSITYWMSISSRRIMLWAKVGSSYTSMHAGLLNSFATTTEYGYPLYIAGSCGKGDVPFNSSSIDNSSIGDPILYNNTSSVPGPGNLRLSSGSWVPCINSAISGGSRVARTQLVVYPAGQPVSSAGPDSNPVAENDRVVRNSAYNTSWIDIIPNTGNPGTQQARLLATPNSDGDISVPIPCTLLLTDSTLGLGVMGEIDGLFWVSGEQASTLISEDTISIGSDRYKVFQSGTRTDLFAFYAVKEA